LETWIYVVSGTVPTYREKYSKIANAKAAAKAAIQQATDELTALETTWRNQDAIEQVRRYFASKEGRDSGNRRIAAMAEIQKCLKPPSFAFTRHDWHDFLKIHEFGNMKRIRRNTDRHLPQIRKAFLYLADESKPLAARVDAVVAGSGRYHVPGIGMNIATKVLAMLNPKGRAVYNKRVLETLEAFGYYTNQGATKGALYAKFCSDMRVFVKDCGIVGYAAHRFLFCENSSRLRGRVPHPRRIFVFAARVEFATFQ